MTKQIKSTSAFDKFQGKAASVIYPASLEYTNRKSQNQVGYQK